LALEIRMVLYNLLSFQSGEGPRAGLLIEGAIHDVAELTGRPCDAHVLRLLEDWGAAQTRLKAAAEQALQKPGLRLKSTKLRTPILFPPAIYCAGANYKDHAEEMARLYKRPVESDPHERGLKCFFFMKTGRTATDPGETIPIAPYSKMLDWEIELAVVIGRPAHQVTEGDALQYVAGYTIGNDLSARDYIKRENVIDTSPFKYDYIGCKNFDRSCPLGPWIVPADHIKDPHNLAMKLTINGVTKQESNTGQMIFDIREQIAHLSARTTLVPGDVIMTGSPAGVGIARNEFLKPGDVVHLSIEGIGTLSHTMA
jgi:2-keto-4-pentenoate hydratase/2-oxohepta-3-ene-1,7-dioic acid hydratase in catechol pathway